MLPQLNLPEFSFKVKSDGQRKYIFDNIRKRYVVLTPEEWVRQNFIAYLINDKKYPASLIAVEMPLKINRLEKRADIVLFSRQGLPMIIVECKSPDVKISQKVFDQAALYNFDLKVKHLIISNGMIHYCAELNHMERKWKLLPEIPGFRDVK